MARTQNKTQSKTQNSSQSPTRKRTSSRTSSSQPTRRRKSKSKATNTESKNKSNTTTQHKKHVSKKRKKKKNYTLYYMFCGIMIATICLVLCLTVFFKIEKIEIQGSQKYTPEDVMNKTGVSLEDNLIRISSSSIEKQLTEFAIDVDHIEVKKKFPNTLLVNFVEVMPSYAIKQDDYYYTISQTGRVTELVRDESILNSVVKISDVNIALSPGKYISDDTYKDYDVIYEKYLEEMKTDEYIKSHTVAEIEAEAKDKFEKYTSFLEYSEYKNIETLFLELENSSISNISDIKFESNIKIYYDNRIWVNIGNMLDLEKKLELAKVVLAEIANTKKGTLDCSIVGKSYFQDE